jgi:hypothetical protein
VTNKFNNPDSDGDYDDIFPIDGVGSGPAPDVPVGPIAEEDYLQAVNALRNRVEWLEAREINFFDKLQAQQTEIVKLKQDAEEQKRSLQVESIKATLRTIQGISTSTKRLQTMPHDMDASHQRIAQYGLPWSNINIPGRDINPVTVPLKIMNWDTVEQERAAKYPDDKANIPLNWYMRQYEHRAGTAKHKEEPAEENTRRGRGDNTPRYRGYRGGRGRGYSRI